MLTPPRAEDGEGYSSVPAAQQQDAESGGGSTAPIGEAADAPLLGRSASRGSPNSLHSVRSRPPLKQSNALRNGFRETAGS